MFLTAYFKANETKLESPDLEHVRYSVATFTTCDSGFIKM